MADIVVVCPICGRTCSISEYVEAETITCPECSSRIPLPNAGGAGSGLSLRKDSDAYLTEAAPKEKAVAPPEEEPKKKKWRTKKKKKKGKEESADETWQKTGVVPNKENVADAMGSVHETAEGIRTPRAIWGVLSFLIVAGVMVGLLYGMKDHPEFQMYYNWTRIGAWGLIGILMIAVAFEDATIQGIFCLFIPVYIIYYTFVRCDSYLLRGAFGGLLVSMIAELHFLGDGAIVVIVQQAMNNFISGGSNLIDAASNESVF